jgi:excisionase family DNA binding protein
VGEDQRSGRDQASTDQSTGRKLTVPEAAEALGISGDAVRSRIKRGTLPTVREGGRVLVVMGATDRPTAQAQPTYPRPGEDRLYEEMKARIRYLEEQVEEEREARRRADTLLARLMDRLPELEAPQEAPPEPPGSPSEVAEEPDRSEPRSDVPSAQEGVQRPWWRRMFRV